MILVPFFASSTMYGSTKNLLSLPFQAPVFFVLGYMLQKEDIKSSFAVKTNTNGADTIYFPISIIKNKLNVVKTKYWWLI